MKKTLIKTIGYIFLIPILLLVGIFFVGLNLFNILEEALEFATCKVEKIFDFYVEKGIDRKVKY